ncbi:hypothetical protein [Streptomyces salinarius]|jgi:hypothetical protein|uniref:hypothetical protein n=1 Tax=Streptomyces salinarius TaxID=2762598 RepID=UPI001644496B|nr:hypothetical protein [Streptomyces salinarius]
MKQVLIMLQYASQLSPRTLALVAAFTVTLAVLSAVLIWAPPERASLVVSLISPVLAAVAVAVFESRRRRR